MIVGNLRYKIIVQQLQKIKDSYGAEQEIYVNYLDLRADVKYLSGTKQVENDAIVNTETIQFTTYYRNILPSCRIVFNDKLYKINSVNEVGIRDSLSIIAELVQGVNVNDNQYILSGVTYTQGGNSLADYTPLKTFENFKNTAQIGYSGYSGANGDNGTSFHWLSSWLSNFDYSVNDVVFYNGSSYICIEPPSSVGILPTNNQYWDLMAQGYGSR
jgi:head-tail adaptor